MGILLTGSPATASVALTSPGVDDTVVTATDPGTLFITDTIQFTINAGTPPPVVSGLIFPLLAAGRIGEKNYGTNPDRLPAPGDPANPSFTLNIPERESITKMHFSVINPQDTRGSGFVTVCEDFLTYKEANKPDHVVFLYKDMQEISPTGANATKVEGEVGPNGVRDWWLYKNASTGVIASTFTGLNHVNVTTNVTADSAGGTGVNGAGNGLIWPEVYADGTTQTMLDNYQTTSETPRVHVYNDVMDHRARSDNMDYDANGEVDDARSDWDTNSTPGKTQAALMREGHKIYANRVRQNNHDDLLFICNNTTWGQEYSGTDLSQMFQGTGAEGIHSHYDNLVDGGWSEGLIATNHPIAGIHTGTGSIVVDQFFGTWRLAQNSCMYLEKASKGPNYTLNHWATFVEIDGSDQAGQINPIVGGLISSQMMALFRWGLASSLLGNNYHFCDNSATPHNMTMQFDEYGTINTSTTGLSFEWLGAPLEPSQLEKELASGTSSVWLGTEPNSIFKREFENGIVLVNTNRALSGAIAIPVTGNTDESSGNLTGGKWKRIQGLQDPTVNDGTTISTGTGLFLNALDGIILERV